MGATVSKVDQIPEEARHFESTRQRLRSLPKRANLKETSFFMKSTRSAKKVAAAAAAAFSSESNTETDVVTGEKRKNSKRTVSSNASSKKRKSKQRKISKSIIGIPTNFKHTNHIGADVFAMDTDTDTDTIMTESSCLPVSMDILKEITAAVNADIPPVPKISPEVRAAIEAEDEDHPMTEEPATLSSASSTAAITATDATTTAATTTTETTTATDATANEIPISKKPKALSKSKDDTISKFPIPKKRKSFSKSKATKDLNDTTTPAQQVPMPNTDFLIPVQPKESTGASANDASSTTSTKSTFKSKIGSFKPFGKPVRPEFTRLYNGANLKISKSSHKSCSLTDSLRLTVSPVSPALRC